MLGACAEHGGAIAPLSGAGQGYARSSKLDRYTAAHDSFAHDVSSTLKMFVANQASSVITVYKDASNGNVTPLYKIGGSNTGLNAPIAEGLDGTHLLYVLNSASITVFAANARGNTAPKYDIKGGLTQLSNPQGLAVDSAGTTYVTNYTGGNNYITVYPPGSNGDRNPSQTIYDGSSFFFIPAGIAVHGNLIYVADIGDNSINEYAASANGIVSPVAVITYLSSPSDVWVDAKGLIYVTNGDSVLVFAANANGPSTPLQNISGSQTLLNGPKGLTVHNSEIAVANSANNSVTVYPQNGNGNIAPLRQIVGANTGLNVPESVAVR